MTSTNINANQTCVLLENHPPTCSKTPDVNDVGTGGSRMGVDLKIRGREYVMGCFSMWSLSQAVAKSSEE